MFPLDGGLSNSQGNPEAALFCGGCALVNTHHIHDGDVAVGEDDGVGGVRHRQEEGKGGTECCWYEDVQRIHLDGFRLSGIRRGSHDQRWHQHACMLAPSLSQTSKCN